MLEERDAQFNKVQSPKEINSDKKNEAQNNINGKDSESLKTIASTES